VALFGLTLLVAILAAPRVPAKDPPPEAFAGIARAVQDSIAKEQIAGAVTLVATPDKVLHLAAAGEADRAAHKPMRPDAMFWIASMTKPITAAAVLMLQDEGKLSVDDPAAKYLPELARLKTADGKPAQPTLRHLLTHTSGMAEATQEESLSAHTLADLIPHYAEKPLQFSPGAKWQYCQSGINSAGRIVEVVSGQSLPDFLRQRLFVPLGLKDTTFYLSREQISRLATPYRNVDGKLQPAHVIADYDWARTNRYPAANGGLYSTAADYARFCQMLLNQGTLGGKQYLTPAAVGRMATIQTGDIKTGFTSGNGWGLGCCVVRQPQGVTAMLSPGTFGHGGAYGTEAWIDPVKRVIYVLMVQRANFLNADASDLRRAFQTAAAAAWEK
jgi:CubicO group peptidase (beta-lactamase class C family)